MMALDPQEATRLAASIGQIYADSELYLLQLIADRISKGLDAPDWAERQLAEVRALQNDVRRHVENLDRVAIQEIRDTLNLAWNRGAEHAEAEVAALRAQPVTFSAAGAIDTHAVAALASQTAMTAAEVAIFSQTVESVRGVQSQILRSAPDAYREVIGNVSGRVIVGVQTRQQMAQEALNSLARKGITGFTDRAGRNWQASSYVEMALRTSTHRALFEGHADRLQSAGYDLVRISSHPNPSPQCQPFEGKILSLSGKQSGTVFEDSALDGSQVKANVYMSLDQAKARGFEHPNCKHTHSLWVPGATAPKVAPYDPQGYEDSQEQRRLERGVRAAKQRQAVAISDAEKAKAQQRVKDWQDRAKTHATETGIPRRLDRERVKVGKP